MMMMSFICSFRKVMSLICSRRKMMMSFICSFRNKNQPNAIYPLGTPSGDKESTCEDAATMIMSLMAQ